MRDDQEEERMRRIREADQKENERRWSRRQSEMINKGVKKKWEWENE